MCSLRSIKDNNDIQTLEEQGWHPSTRGGGHSTFFFGGCVPHGFPKVGSRERIFLEK